VLPGLGEEAALLARDGIALLLAFAAITKLADWSNSVAALTMYIGLRRARRVLPALVAAELGIASLLLVGLETQKMLFVAALLFAGFTVVLATRLGRTSSEESCGCFGLGLPSRVSGFAVARNAFLVLVCIGVAVSNPVHGASGSLAPPEFLWLLAPASCLPLVVISLGALESIRGRRRFAEQDI
jgi:hypothetical protein